MHTNLGRAPLRRGALERVGRGRAAATRTSSTTSPTATRGSRQDHVAAILRRLTGAEAAIVVNNNAAAMLLALAALAEGREVLVSRGELIEIGDGFRIPDVLARSGARLVEVGTTNRTRAADYERACGAETALLLRVHQSNFRVVGFTERPTLEGARRRRARARRCRCSTTSAPARSSTSATSRRRAASLADGADLVCFSGDKLLGGPQAGIVVGRADLVERLRRHPLHRALRIDKLGLAALEGTLLLYLEPERALREVPVLRMLHEDADGRARARRAPRRPRRRRRSRRRSARVGGGALPLAELAVVRLRGRGGARGTAAQRTSRR